MNQKNPTVEKRWDFLIIRKTDELRQLGESFGQAFSKACGGRTRSPPRAPQSAKIAFGVFLFVNGKAYALLTERSGVCFHFAPIVSKEKAAKEFIKSDETRSFYLSFKKSTVFSTVDFSLYFSYAISVMISCDANTISTKAMG
jgi:hypothetical protein